MAISNSLTDRLGSLKLSSSLATQRGTEALTLELKQVREAGFRRLPDPQRRTHTSCSIAAGAPVVCHDKGYEGRPSRAPATSSATGARGRGQELEAHACGSPLSSRHSRGPDDA